MLFAGRSYYRKLSRHCFSSWPLLAASSALFSRSLRSETISYLILSRVPGRRRLGQYRRIRSSAPLIFLAIDRISLFIRALIRRDCSVVGLKVGHAPLMSKHRPSSLRRQFTRRLFDQANAALIFRYVTPAAMPPVFHRFKVTPLLDCRGHNHVSRRRSAAPRARNPLGEPALRFVEFCEVSHACLLIGPIRQSHPAFVDAARPCQSLIGIMM